MSLTFLIINIKRSQKLESSLYIIQIELRNGFPIKFQTTKKTYEI